MSVNLTTLGTSCKESWSIWLFRTGLFQLMSSRFIHAVAYVRILFLRLNKDLSSWLYHILFIRLLIKHSRKSSVNNAALNIGMKIPAWVSAFHSFGYMPKSKIVGSYVILYLTFWGTTKLFSTVAAPFYITTSNTWKFQFICIFTKICYFLCVFLK